MKVEDIHKIPRGQRPPAFSAFVQLTPWWKRPDFAAGVGSFRAVVDAPELACRRVSKGRGQMKGSRTDAVHVPVALPSRLVASRDHLPGALRAHVDEFRIQEEADSDGLHDRLLARPGPSQDSRVMELAGLGQGGNFRFRQDTPHGREDVRLKLVFDVEPNRMGSSHEQPAHVTAPRETQLDNEGADLCDRCSVRLVSAPGTGGPREFDLTRVNAVAFGEMRAGEESQTRIALPIQITCESCGPGALEHTQVSLGVVPSTLSQRNEMGAAVAMRLLQQDITQARP